MRLALITPGFASPGEANFAIPALTDTVRTLAERHEVHVFTLRYPHRRDTYGFHGATVHAFGWGTAGGANRLRLLQSALAAIRREHRRQPFDLFHGLWADEPGFVASSAGRLLGRPSVVSLLGGELIGFPDIGYGGLLSRSNRWLTGQALRRASAVTVGSHFLRQIAAAHVSNDRLHVLPLGVDTQLFKPNEMSDASRITFHALTSTEPPADPAFHILHVASLSPVKDQATLLDTLAIVANQHPEVHLHIVGSGPLQPSLAAQAGALGASAHVTFHGEVAHEQLPLYYRAADLFLLSSRYESQSMVVLEATACGCPVAGTAVGVLPELLDPTQVVPVGDAGALAGAIDALISDPARRTASARESRAAVLAHFALDRTGPELELLYQGLPAGIR
ncbi:MAG: glycosyltransferase [Caldilineae bacterium]|nr:glycosyltransferase [Anaerolineae bacterium]MCB0253326.1 glycosyltransferase [Anaerolineae bacterium]MCB9154434.1 glycosyltransferase [Caldilineae bacterium]